MKIPYPFQFNLNTYPNPDQVYDSIFWGWVVSGGLHVEELSWPCEVELPPIDSRNIYRACGRKTKFSIYWDYWIVGVLLCAGIAHVKIGYSDAKSLKDALDFCKINFPKAAEKPDGIVPFYFWRHDPNGGARQFVRDIIVPSWESVCLNYPAKTRSELQYLVKGFTPSTSGNMLLWYGVPGTGKTWAIRTLSREWKEWATFNYILDPENFFGGEVSYLTEVLLDNETTRSVAVADYPVELDDEEVESLTPEKWRVFILEDCGEMLTVDAKDRMGQALSRLLNVVDGLIGQGLKLIFIITTNEKVSALHEAVSRPGRCSFSHCFDKFSEEEAQEWLRSKSADESKVIDKGQLSLAELYAIHNDWHQKMGSKQPLKVGF